MLQGKFALGSVSRVGLAENGVAVTRDNLTSLESRPHVLPDSIVARVLANLALHLAKPNEHFLVRKTMEGTRKAVQGSGEGEEGIGKSGTNELASVRRDVATLVVTVNSDIETKELNKIFLLSEAEEVGKIPGIVLVWIDSWELATSVNIAVDATGNIWQFGNPEAGARE